MYAIHLTEFINNELIYTQPQYLLKAIKFLNYIHFINLQKFFLSIKPLKKKK